MLFRIRKFIGWGLLGLLLLFIFFNLQPAQIRLFIMRVEMPIAFVIILSAALGAGAVYALKFMKHFTREEKK
jgi:uncharacterized integral membrane protein